MQIPTTCCRYVVAMLGNYDASEAFEVDVDGVRKIPIRGPPVELKSIEEGGTYDCWYAQEEQFYMVTVESITEHSTLMVTFEGFDDQDEVPLQYLLVPEDEGHEGEGEHDEKEGHDQEVLEDDHEAHAEEEESAAEDLDPNELAAMEDQDYADDGDLDEKVTEHEEEENEVHEGDEEQHYADDELGHIVSFSLSLADWSVDEFDAEAEESLIDDIANGIGVDPNQVQILSISAGSVIVDAQVVGLEDESAAASVADAIEDAVESGQLLNESFGSCELGHIEISAPDDLPENVDDHQGDDHDALNEDEEAEEDAKRRAEEAEAAREAAEADAAHKAEEEEKAAAEAKAAEAKAAKKAEAAKAEEEEKAAAEAKAA